MRILSAVTLLLVAAPLACAHPTQPAPMSDTAKTTYAIGYAISKNLGPFDLEPDELDAVLLGLRDGVEGREPRIDIDEWGAKTRDVLASRQQHRAAPEEAASQEWLAEVAKESGATRMDSGLLFLETRAGKGKAPTESDKVVVHYKGTLRDGSVFDDSRKAGEPATVPLSAAIACWKEALPKMKPGGEASFWCPSALAYSYVGSGSIPPGAALRFDVELLEVVTP